MAKIEGSKQQQYAQRYKQLIQQQKTLIISSVSTEAQPECSYAPFVRDLSGVFYVFVSDLAVHTKNMLENNRASIMFIQAETEAENLFARERVIFNCTVNETQKNQQGFEEQLQCLQQKFGETMGLLRSLPDFHLLAIKPVDGRYVAGFGQAFKVNVLTNTLEF